ncbi:MAG: CHAT domain-containing protein, partial [Candidatus Eremiobacterota bacterium]
SGMTSEELARGVRGARLVHLATHGLLDSRAPLFSGLVASDSLVTVTDIMDWDMQADLTVLSACQTGLGGFQGGRGDDMVGLSRAFQFAGSRSVLASLWKVSDEATSEWMAAFHRELAAGTPPGTAARKAGLKLREKYPHPFFWAPFVLVGSGD